MKVMIHLTDGETESHDVNNVSVTGNWLVLHNRDDSVRFIHGAELVDAIATEIPKQVISPVALQGVRS
jgi:hypothetical protein